MLAEDQFGFFSEPVTVNIIPNLTSVREPGLTCSLYPNPSFDLLYIETGQPGVWSIDVSAANGRFISNHVFHGSVFQLDLSSLQKGIYFITVRSKDFVTTRKVIKL